MGTGPSDSAVYVRLASRYCPATAHMTTLFYFLRQVPISMTDGPTRRQLLQATGGAIAASSLVGYPTRTVRGQEAERGWPQFGRDVRNSGAAPGNSGPSGDVGTAWEFPAIGAVNDDAVVVGDSVVVSTRSEVVGLSRAGCWRIGIEYPANRARGRGGRTRRWRTVVGETQPRQCHGPRLTRTVLGSRLYFRLAKKPELL